MNNSRRKRINNSTNNLIDAKKQLEMVLTEERNALAKTPNNEEYETMRDGMDDIISGLEDTLSSLEEAIDTLECADF